MSDFYYLMADRDYFAPLETSTELGTIYRPSTVAEGWAPFDSDIWTMWKHDGERPVQEGWKVHVSAQQERLAEVLDVVSATCFELDVPFKHVRAQLFYLWMHHKHAVRSQAGKFCAAYPKDEETAGRLMALLDERLPGEEGAYVLTDRRYRDARSIYYRYGGFARHHRVRADGTHQSLVRDGNGELVEDKRGVSFHLPAGVTDPFVVDTETKQPGLSFHGFTFQTALQHSNGGGTYRGEQDETGRTVFIKEARDHAGLTWEGRTAVERQNGEWETLQAVHAAEPGLCPEPVAYFREWEHEFMVTEFVPGKTLQGWCARHSPYLKPFATAEDFAEFDRRARKIFTALEDSIHRLHELGYVFVDISPTNVLVDDDDNPRLIDFETAHRIGAGKFTPMGTEGYFPPDKTREDDPREFDEYGLAAIAQLLLFPLHSVVQRNPHVLTHLRAEFVERAPLPEDLWHKATRLVDFSAPAVLPGPDEAAADPVRHVSELRSEVARGLLAQCDVEHPDRVFPTVPLGYRSNTLCVAYGTAGVLHALRHTGFAAPDGVLDRLRREVVEKAEMLPPGLHTGSAGIAWVLADHGMVDEAIKLLDEASVHPLLAESATFGGGRAGVALANLALYGHVREQRFLDRASELLHSIPVGDVTPLLGPDNATGMLHGRTGIALAMQQFAAVTGDPVLLDRGIALLHAELDLAADLDAPALYFPVSDVDRRQMPYLYSGTAGVLRTVTRFLRQTPDERLHEVLPRLLPPTQATMTVMSGLYQGLSGLGFVLAEHAALTGDPDSAAAAMRSARAMLKYAIPHESGVRMLGDRAQRLSADLWSGTAGVLLFLDTALNPRTDTLFTVDGLAAEAVPTLLAAAG